MGRNSPSLSPQCPARQVHRRWLQQRASQSALDYLAPKAGVWTVPATHQRTRHRGTQLPGSTHAAQILECRWHGTSCYRPLWPNTRRASEARPCRDAELRPRVEAAEHGCGYSFEVTAGDISPTTLHPPLLATQTGNLLPLCIPLHHSQARLHHPHGASNLGAIVAA